MYSPGDSLTTDRRIPPVVAGWFVLCEKLTDARGPLSRTERAGGAGPGGWPRAVLVPAGYFSL